MKMPLAKVFLLLSLTVVTTAWLSAQSKFTLSGYVRDAETGEDIPGASVLVPSIGQGAFTNTYGFYSLTLPQADYRVVVRSPGYPDDTLSVALDQNRTINVELNPLDYQLGPVVIEDEREDDNISSTEVGAEKIQLKEIRRLPAFMGEVDVIRTIQLLPGVASVGEGITGYYVRGGQTNQNLVLLDNATVYNASHLLGFFSVFNADALKSEYKLYKGGIPARYGGRLASVLDLGMREGNMREFKATGGIGVLASRLTVEGPIAKDKASFILSGRRTYADLFLLASGDPDVRNTSLYFYDFNAKANYRISDRDRIFVSGYFGRDVFKFRDFFANDWGNSTGSLRWNHLFSDRLFSNATVIYSDFFYGFDGQTFTGEGFEFSSGIRDIAFKYDWNWFANPRNEIKFGLDVTLHKFQPGLFEPTGETFLQDLEVQPDYAFESVLYLSNNQKITDRLTVDYGLRYSLFDQVGPGEEYNYGEDGETPTDTTQFSTGELIQHYHGLEPRVSAVYLLDERSSVKGSFMRTRQYIHLVSNSTASFPWDIWVPSSRHIAPQISDQVSVGYFRNFFDNDLESSVELYYKWMNNQIDFKNGAELFLNPTIETEVLVGEGWSYGAEFLLRKPRGRLTGWLGYTLSKTLRQIDGINEGEPYAANSDRRHDISLVSTYQLTDRMSLGFSWVYSTGRRVTYPVGGYYLDSTFVPQYDGRNNDRMPDNHRLDLSLTIDPKKREDANQKRRLESSWNFSLYNAYGRRNPFAINFREETEERPVAGQPGVTEEVRVRRAYLTYLFRWVPSVTWNFNF
ncbi:MAG: TonB-dependent receptor [Bacteroidota bacterium]